MSSKTSKIAKALVSSGALKFGSFKLKSRARSPYYIDLTWLLSSPEDFRSVVNVVAEEIKPMVSSGKVSKLASIELKGALLLPSIASILNMPCVVIRKKSKTYGLIEKITGGVIRKGDHVVFFDDLITSGASKLEAIKLIEEAGGKIEAIVVIIDREQGGKENLKKQGYQVKSVTTISKIVKSLVSAETLPHDQIIKILGYLKKV